VLDEQKMAPVLRQRRRLVHLLQWCRRGRGFRSQDCGPSLLPSLHQPSCSCRVQPASALLTRQLATVLRPRLGCAFLLSSRFMRTIDLFCARELIVECPQFR